MVDFSRKVRDGHPKVRLPEKTTQPTPERVVPEARPHQAAPAPRPTPDAPAHVVRQLPSTPSEHVADASEGLELD